MVLNVEMETCTHANLDISGFVKSILLYLKSTTWGVCMHSVDNAKQQSDVRGKTQGLIKAKVLP